MKRNMWQTFVVALIALGVGTACGLPDEVFSPPTGVLEHLYWSLEINHPAIRLATHSPYDTVTVVAQPFAPGGVHWIPATNNDSVSAMQPTQWYSTDSARVRVTQDGLIRAHKETGTTVVYIVAKRTIGEVTHSDSTLVQVVQVTSPPVLDSFTVRPTDSLKRAAGSVLLLKPQFFDSSGNVLSGFPVHYQVSNEKIAKGANPWSASLTVDNVLTPVIGRTFVRARTWVYGIAKMDTFTLESGYPIVSFISPRADLRLSTAGVWEPYLVGADLHLGPGATISFGNHTGRTMAEVEQITGEKRGLLGNGPSVSFLFDKPDSVWAALSPAQNSGPGNVLDIPGDTLAPWATRNRYRRFPFPGRYEYTVEPFGFRGAVVIHDR